MNLPSSPSSRRFDGRHVLITGAAAGIGAAIAQLLADEGASLILLDRDEQALAAVAERLGKDTHHYAVDVSDAAQTEQVFDRIQTDCGRIHAAVLNAGIVSLRIPLHEVAVEDFDRILAVNVRGVFLWLSRLLGHMREHRGGAITITASTAGLKGTIGMAPYVASKHAVVGLMKSAALEAAPFGIRVNCVNPGPVETAMMESVDRSTGDLEVARRRGFASIPLGRYGSTHEIAAITAFLCSDDASFCTGATYLADGGLTAR